MYENKVEYVFTNEIEINLNMEKIRKDFYIYRVLLKKGVRDFANAVKEIKNIFNSNSLVKNGNAYFVIKTQKVNIDFFYKYISDIKEVDFERVKKIVTLKLLIRILPSLKSIKLFDEESVSLVDGLFYFAGNEEGLDVIKTLNIDIEEYEDKYYLTFGARVATKGKKLSENIKKRYIPFTFKISALVRDMEIDIDEAYFLKSHRKDKKINIPYFDWKNFEFSKIGIVAKFLKDVELYLKDYVTIELKKESIEKFSKRKISNIKKDIDMFVKEALKYDINIVNYTKISEEKLIKIFEIYKNAKVKLSNAPQEECLNLILLHNKDYYKNNDNEDPYKEIKKKFKKIATNIVTVEAIESLTDKNAKIYIDVVLKELLLKKYLLNKKIVKNFWINKDLLFALKNEMEVGKFVIYGMRIDKDGNIQFLNSLEDYSNRYLKKLSYELIKEKKVKYGILDLENNEIVLIYETIKKPLPDIKALDIEYKKYKKTILLKREKKLKLIEKYKNNCDKDVFNILKIWADEEKDFSFLIKNLSKKEKEKFSKFLIENGYRINTTGLRGNNGYLAYLKDIRLNPLNNEYYAFTSFAINTKINNSPVIRKLNSLKEWYFKMLEVGFVRTNDITVLPYPIKLLREEMNVTK